MLLRRQQPRKPMPVPKLVARAWLPLHLVFLCRGRVAAAFVLLHVVGSERAAACVS